MANSKALSKRDEKPEAMSIAGFKGEMVDIIRNVVAKDLNDYELSFFLHRAKAMGLDPISRQIYAFKSKSGLNIGAYIDGLRLLAQRTGDYSPGSDTEYEYDEKGKLISAKAFVKRWMPKSGEWMESSEVAYLSEFRGTSPTWQNMPRVMLGKCAEARALRRAFPAELSGIYAQEESDAICQNSRSIHSPNDAFRNAIQKEASTQVQAEVVSREPDNPPPEKAAAPQNPPQDDEDAKYQRLRKEVWDMAVVLYGMKSAESELRRLAKGLGVVFEKLTIENLGDVLDALHQIQSER